MKKDSKKIKTNSGAAMLISVIFFLFISLAIISGLVSPSIREFRNANVNLQSKQSYFLAESGNEDAIYRISNNINISSNETLTLNSNSATTSITNVGINEKDIVSLGNVSSLQRTNKIILNTGTGISFHYGIQSGNGGISLNQSASVTGNVYASGPVFGLNHGTNYIYGDVVSSGPSGIFYWLHATGNVYAHTIGKTGDPTFIDKNAYYQVKVSPTTVTGTSNPNSSDLGSVDLPISDDQITNWESDATAGGTLSSNACDSYSASSNTCTVTSTRTWGPAKIPFNLVFKNNSAVLTVAGPLWITGNFDIQSGSTVQMLPSLGSTNVAIIADDQTNRAGSGVITVGQSSIFLGSGSPGSFVFLISQNNSGENGGSITAISLAQGASALVAYASHGIISLSQSVGVKEVTAFKLSLTQSANVTYDSGLPSTIFESGPSGGWNIKSWLETQ